MTIEDLRSLGQSIVDTCNALDASEAATAAVQAQLDGANATIAEDATERADLQSQLDAAHITLAGDVQALASLQAAFDAYKAAHPDVDIHEFADFTTQSSGMYVPTGALAGRGSAVTTYRMKPQSNTKAPNVLLALMRAGGLGSTQAAKVNLQGFTLQGTDQAGVEYQGLIVGWGTGSTVTDVTVNGIPGSSSAPTATGGETASLSLLHSTSAALANVNLDGHRADGTQVAATLFEMNYTTGDTTWNRGSAVFAKYGFGAALFQCSGTITFSDVDFRFNRKAINIEQSLACTYRFVRCDFRGTAGATYIAQISSNALTVSNRITFEDCVFDNDQCVVNTYSSAANGGKNGQKDTDIRRVDGGVDVTATAAKFKITHL